MAARTDAAALCSPLRCLSFSFLIFLFFFCFSYCKAKYSYNHLELRKIGYNSQISITSDYQRMHNILLEIVRKFGALWILIGSAKKCMWRKERKQKQECRTGLLATIKKQPFKLQLPSIFLTNARLVIKKIDELNLLLTAQQLLRNCCVLVVTETWLR